MGTDSLYNQKLIKAYPFVSDILSEQMEPYNGQDDGRLDNLLIIRVQKADADLMFKRAHNLGLGNSDSCAFSTIRQHEMHIGKRGEYMFAIDNSEKIINRVDWPRDREEQRKADQLCVYASDIFWSQRHERIYSGSIIEKVKYLVWVTVEAWYTDNKYTDDKYTGNERGYRSRFGELLSTSIRITIYQEPEQGFEKLLKESNLYESLVLDTRLLQRGLMMRDVDIITMRGMLGEMCITFQDEVYFNGMKEMREKVEFRSASGKFGAVRVLCAEMCGCDFVTLRDVDSQITFRVYSDFTHMHVVGQTGTLPQIRNLVKTVVRMWNQNTEARNAFKTNEDLYVV
ncbi:hypothetical protein GYA37_00245 [candidate division WWE3 bacterium]|uniref:Uncharacterized protein n=1 Tax=candidate division WWE3 bacterium TaxID=2053526 RepID=A0A7X9HS39_UNCKA|nr:hypothetical protein [candidate division WWE3 bacterium]